MIIISSFVASLCAAPHVNSPGYDREVFHYAAMVLLEGGHLYKDVFLHRLPGVAFLSIPSVLMGDWGLWVVESLLLSLSLLLLFYACPKKYGWTHLATICFLAFFMRTPDIFEGGGLSRTYILPFIASSWFLVNRKIRYQRLAWGAVLFLSFFLQQNEILVPLFFWFIWVSRSDQKLRDIFSSAIFGIGLMGLFSLFLFMRGNFFEMWDQAFVFNRAYLGMNSNWLSRPLFYFQALHHLGLLKIWLAIAILALTSTFQLRWRSLLGALVFSFFLASISASLSGRFYGHYFNVPAFLTIILVVEIVEKIRSQYGARAVITALLLLPLILPVHRWLAVFAKSQPGLLSLTEKREILEELEPYRGKRDSLWILRGTEVLDINTRLRIIAPSKWVHTHFWDQLATFDPSGKGLQTVLDRVSNSSNEYILEFLTVRPFRRESYNQMVLHFLRSSYEPAKHLSNGGVLWRKR